MATLQASWGRTDAALAGALLLLGILLFLMGAGLSGQGNFSLERIDALTLEELLGTAAAGLGALLVFWWWAAFICAAAAQILARTGRTRAAEVSRRMSPAFMQRLVLAAVSFQLLSGAAAHAAPAPGPEWGPTQGQEATAPATLAAVNPVRSSGDIAAPAAQRPTTSGEPKGGPPTAGADAGASADALPLAQDSGSVVPSRGPAYLPVPDPGAPAPPPSASAVNPGWQPSAPAVGPDMLATPPARASLPTHEAADEVSGGVAVLAGDTLWDIVSLYLGSGASDVDIALEWPRWYEANRSVIGPNPDTLLPGQVLLPPSRA